MKEKRNKFGEKLYPVRVSEIDSNTRMKLWWTMAEIEFADHLIVLNGLGYIENVGYIYKFDALKAAMEKAFENPYWKERLATS